MCITSNISVNFGVVPDKDGLTIDKQNFNLAILFSLVRAGLIAFVCGLRAPSLILLCMVDFETPTKFARERILVRRHNGVF